MDENGFSLHSKVAWMLGIMWANVFVGRIDSSISSRGGVGSLYIRQSTKGVAMATFSPHGEISAG